eukprot:m.194915 g.194915  ORF g.194915 m.194915 type:complete len:485 (-) comp18669_c0_seq2:59-1513(-)
MADQTGQSGRARDPSLRQTSKLTPARLQELQARRRGEHDESAKPNDLVQIGQERSNKLLETSAKLAQMQKVLESDVGERSPTTHRKKVSRISSMVYDAQGTVTVRATYDERRKRATLHVICATNLPIADANGFSDPYVKVWLFRGTQQIKKSKRKTKIMYKNLNPVFNEALVYDNISMNDVDEMRFHIEVMDYDKVGSNDFLGHAWLPLARACMQHNDIEIQLREASDNTEWVVQHPRRETFEAEPLLQEAREIIQEADEPSENDSDSSSTEETTAAKEDTPAPPEVEPEAVERLVAYGFEPDECRQALIQFEGKENEALAHLFNTSDTSAPPVGVQDSLPTLPPAEPLSAQAPAKPPPPSTRATVRLANTYESSTTDGSDADSPGMKPQRPPPPIVGTPMTSPLPMAVVDSGGQDSSAASDTVATLQGVVQEQSGEIEQLRTQLSEAQAKVEELKESMRARDRYLDTILAKIMVSCPDILAQE